MIFDLENDAKETLKKYRPIKLMKTIKQAQQYGYPHPILFIACLPKTGSTWLARLLAEIIPGFEYRNVKWQLAESTDLKFDLTDEVLKSLFGGLYVARGHTAATSNNLNAIKSTFGRCLFLVRDPRDIIVSYYHYLIIKYNKTSSFSLLEGQSTLTPPWKTIPADVLTLDRETCLDILIEQVFPSLVDFAQTWLDRLENNEQICLIKYEDMTVNSFEEVKRILNFYKLKVNRWTISQSLKKLSPNENWKNEEKTQINFRQGKIGTWKQELSTKQQIRCEAISEPLLRRLNY